MRESVKDCWISCSIFRLENHKDAIHLYVTKPALNGHGKRRIVVFLHCTVETRRGTLKLVLFSSNTSTPDVTILCSNYNSSAWIEGYCRSLNEQLLPGFSVIFVDASSTDDSVSQFRSYEFREGIETEVVLCDRRISVYEAWNIAIKKARTQYCMNVNTDDRLYPAALLTMLSYAAVDPDIDIRYSPCFVTRDPGHKKLADILDWPEFSHAALLKMCICGPFPLLKRAAIAEAGLFNPEYLCSGDYEMWLRMSKLGYRFRKIPEVIGTYYDNPAGLSTSQEMTQKRAVENTKLHRLYT